jgi:hypothetical protein
MMNGLKQVGGHTEDNYTRSSGGLIERAWMPDAKRAVGHGIVVTPHLRWVQVFPRTREACGNPVTRSASSARRISFNEMPTVIDNCRHFIIIQVNDLRAEVTYARNFS